MYLLRLATIALLVAAIAVYLAQPFKESADLAALVAIAGLLATVLSLALTVTLLVAQHTAERHAHALYAEFRRERAWLVTLASLGVGVITIVAWSLLAATISTGWAALALAAALGLFAASLFPRLLDSLDRTELARRITDRIVDRLHEIGRKTDVIHRESELKPVASRGIEIASGLAVEGISGNDREVVRAGFAGTRRVLIAYLAGSPTRGWDPEIINYSFQHLESAIDLAVGRSPVLLLPVALEELTTLGVESPTVLRPVDQYENVSGRLNGLFLDIVARTLTADSSGAAAMATSGIGSGGVALVQADRPNGVIDHIRGLRWIAGAASRAERDHVAGQANRELARLAFALARLNSVDIMPGNLYQDACAAFGQSVDMFVARTTPDGALMRDTAMTPVVSPVVTPNLSAVVIAGLMAHQHAGTPHRRGFAYGNDALMHSLLQLTGYRTGVLMTPTWAMDTAHSAVVGALALASGDDLAEQVTRWWLDLVRQLIDPNAERLFDSPAVLKSLFLVGVYVVEEDRPDVGVKMRERLGEALRLTQSITDDFNRRRTSQAWLPAGRAAVGSGDSALAKTISAVIASDIRALRVATAGRPWYEPSLFGHGDDFYHLVPGTPFRTMSDYHRRPEIRAEFQTLLDAAAPMSRRRARSRSRSPKAPE
jgi:hypothetical protein